MKGLAPPIISGNADRVELVPISPIGLFCMIPNNAFNAAVLRPAPYLLPGLTSPGGCVFLFPG